MSAPGPGPGPGAGPRVLYVSSNGAGMGHLTRLLAMALRSRPGTERFVASLSQAVPVVAEVGIDYEYIPSRGDVGGGPRWWNALFARRFAELLRRERPDVVVFDGTYPYEGLLRSREVLPDVRLVWSRRGMWLPGRGASQLARAGDFDLVLEPGELAAEEDRGATGARDDAVRVDPVTLLDAAELLPREEAAEALGVDPSRRTALVTLGAGTINDIGSDLGRVVAGLGADPDLQVVVTRPVIADHATRFAVDVRGVSVYPVSRYLRCVDLAVAASGYNAFHELVGFGVPTAFVPNTSTSMDDQVARARWVERVGAGLHVPALDAAGVARVVEELGDPASCEQIAARAREVARPNGAGPAQRLVEELVGAGR